MAYDPMMGEDWQEGLQAAVGHLEDGRRADAERLLRDLPATGPGMAGPLIHLGALFFDAGRPGEAADCFRRALEFRTGDAPLHNNLGQALRAAGESGAAAREFLRAADLDAKFAEPLNHLGALSRAGGDPGQAVEFYRQALARRPDFAEAHFNLAIALEVLEQPERAITHYRRAIEKRPSYIKALNNLGALLDQMGDHAAAEAALRQALVVAPDQPELLNSLGNCLRAQGRLFEARQAFSRAISQEPDFNEASWNLSLIQLAGGDFQQGWANYRHRHGVDRESLAMPGASLPAARRGGKFFIEGEQGLGDELFFLRFVDRLKVRGARVIYRPEAKIASLCRRLSFLDGLAGPDQAAGLDQIRVTVADLPFLLAAGDCPPSVRLAAEPVRIESFRRRLAAAGPPPYLGITWRAGMVRPGSLFKQAPLEDVARALAPARATVINLQRAPEPGETDRLRDILGRAVVDFSHVNEDLEDMLALLSLIDDYVGVSNTNMHLRAAAGLGGRVLVTNPAEYRWMAHGGTSPWFPGFRLYREAAGGGWEPAIRNLGRDLIAAHGGGVPGP